MPKHERAHVYFLGVPVCSVWDCKPLVKTAHSAWQLMAMFNSFVFDYVARQKIGGSNMTLFIVNQLAALSPARFHEVESWSVTSIGDWLKPRIAELTYTADDLVGFGID